MSRGLCSPWQCVKWLLLRDSTRSGTDCVPNYEMKHQIVHTLQKYLLNPPIKLVLAIGLPLPGSTLLETTGRKSGKPRRTPLGDGRVGNQFWLVAEHGMKAGYIRNIERDPHVSELFDNYFGGPNNHIDAVTEAELKAEAITKSDAAKSVIEKFRERVS